MRAISGSARNLGHSGSNLGKPCWAPPLGAGSFGCLRNLILGLLKVRRRDASGTGGECDANDWTALTPSDVIELGFVFSRDRSDSTRRGSGRQPNVCQASQGIRAPEPLGLRQAGAGAAVIWTDGSKLQAVMLIRTACPETRAPSPEPVKSFAKETPRRCH